jgi:Fur family ferric uptake transcriptional regulator
MIIALTIGYRRCVARRTQPKVTAGARELLQQRGITPTRQRAAVVEVLAAEPNDVTAQQIHDVLRARGAAVGLATVYRTLAVLRRAGVVDTLSHMPGEACYRLCGPEHHHHLVCSACHRVVELTDCGLDDWLSQASASHGFVATGHRLEAIGICSDCRPA